MREKVGKSRNTVFFQWEGRKVGSLKRRVRSHLARWEMKNCTVLWREAHFEPCCYDVWYFEDCSCKMQHPHHQHDRSIIPASCCLVCKLPYSSSTKKVDFANPPWNRPMNCSCIPRLRKANHKRSCFTIWNISTSTISQLFTEILKPPHSGAGPPREALLLPPGGPGCRSWFPSSARFSTLLLSTARLAKPEIEAPPSSAVATELVRATWAEAQGCTSQGTIPRLNYTSPCAPRMPRAQP